jgi:pilus assembly protein CpaF
MDVQIVIQSDDGKERNEIFPADAPISIGRHPQCVVCLDSDLVSRQHAVVDVGPKSVRVEDLSTNGTLAGDKLLRRNSLDIAFGTPIVVGNFTIYFFPIENQARPRTVSTDIALKQTRGTESFNQTRAEPFTLPPTKASSSPQLTPAQRNGTPAQTSPVRITAKAAPTATERSAAQAAATAAMTPSQLTDAIEARKKNVELRRKIHKLLLEHLDLATIDAQKLDDPSMRPKVLTALRRIVEQIAAEIPPELSRDTLIGELADEALGLGPLERFLADPSISEVMVVDPSTIYIEKGGKIILSEATFTDDERVRGVIERIVTPLGRRIDESSPLVDARLKDGSRVNAVIRPIALRGSCITIRKFAKTPLTLENLMSFGAMTPQMGQFLCRCVIAKRNIIISGGTGSGKTTLLNVLSGAIPEDERIVTIEDAAELQLKQPHVVSLETRPANLEGKGEYSIRDLVKNALRMRPDRIVVGECRGGEALDMLQAMNTGHDGSLTTTHANSPLEAIARIETLVLMAGVELPVRAIREQIANSIHIVAQATRLADGARKVIAISEVTGINEDSHEIEVRPIFEFVRTGTGQAGKVVGEFRATGYLPSFLNDFIVMGLVKRGEAYL